MGVSTFVIIVLALTAVTVIGAYSLSFSSERGALTLAVRKKIILCIVGIAGVSWTFFVSLPGAQSPMDYVFPFVSYILIPIAAIYSVFYIVEETRDSQWFHDRYRQGRGGSARWAGEATFRAGEMASNWGDFSRISEPKAWIFLGRSKSRFDSFPRNVGRLDDEHMLTFGITGGGKSVFVLYNNLSIWPGSMFVLDPKGELAANTIEARQSKFKSKCRILCPFPVRDLNGKYDELKCRYNPLSEIDPEDPGAMGLVRAIANAVIIPSAKQDTYWVENGQLILEGSISHLLTTFPKEEQTLPVLVNHLSDEKQFMEFVSRMSVNEAMGGMPARAASLVKMAGERTRGILLTEIARSLKWIMDPPMREHLSGSDFSMKELREEGNTSVYVVLPLENISNSAHNRWMRVLMRVSLVLIQRADKKPNPPVLYVLDEFPALGRFESVQKDFRELRGAGVKLWIFAQDVAALTGLYGEGWNSFAGNSTVQFLGLGNCNQTLKWVSNRLGEFIKKEETGAAISRPLMEEAEVKSFLSKNAENQIIIPVDGAPWQIDSVNYFNNRHAYRKK